MRMNDDDEVDFTFLFMAGIILVALLVYIFLGQNVTCSP